MEQIISIDTVTGRGYNVDTCSDIVYKGKSPCSMCHNKSSDKNRCSVICRARRYYQAGMHYSQNDIPSTIEIDAYSKSLLQANMISTSEGGREAELNRIAVKHGYANKSEMVVKMRRSGKKFGEIAELFDVYPQAVYRWYVIADNRPVVSRPALRAIREKKIAMCKKLFDKNMKRAEISRKTGIPASTVYGFFATARQKN